MTIDPLANDISPDGAILVLHSVEVPDGSGLEVAVLGHGLLRITATGSLPGPVVLHYVVSDGLREARGEVLVRPLPASATQQPPVVPDATATVRTGGVVTIPVLDGAFDPEGGPLTLLPDLAEPLGEDEGLLFVSGDVLRYRAPDRPTTARASFTVTDATGAATSARLTVTVHAADATTKAPPQPAPVTARVFAGEITRITVPLVGVDPDGDGVTLLGLDRAPEKGRVVDTGADWIDYEAFGDESGTDQFTYAVEDWVGQRAVATVRVGIAERPGTSERVVARDDRVTVLPGRRVEVRVLANDVDAGGSELTLDPALVTDPGVDARTVGRRVVVQSPQAPGTLQIAYTARNDRGGHATAVLWVTVDPDASPVPPVARDVVVPARDTVGRTEVEVDVLAVAENRSGPLSDLTVSVPDDASTARTTPTGAVVVTLAEHAQTLPYVLTNTAAGGGGLTSTAFITVPALGDFPDAAAPRAAARGARRLGARDPARRAGAGGPRSHRHDLGPLASPGHQVRRIGAGA
ncbi:Ig-like domain-containing protein [Cellulomonas sp. ATA003]|uniref:Ig-like domain-containing protein n=1 Tax=Cellulomonas sp. ATA003 TaxID=3073064 RepID=UPI00287354D8|nr:Ig-like domain-containing protein [Cellulomonas sp. ATA003]WNB85967.1 Ig-like domain-containing protein [Cellulomonas sp. ATA003]